MTGWSSEDRDTLLTTAGDQAAVATPALATTLPASTTVPADRRRIGRYELARNLGSGGMGVVWEAIDPELGRGVAIKLVREERRAGLGDRLMREAQTLAQLQHPNVVTVYDVGIDAGELYIVMELVDGTTLDRVLADRKRTRDEIITLMVQAGRGLAAAHAAGIVHRDFKPSNVLVDHEGAVKVSDFGLACASDRSADETSSSTVVDASLTRGDLVGTPAYMAPEQFLGGPVTPATDQFSFCITLWEALVGTRPFAGNTVEQLRDAVIAGNHAEVPARLPRRVRAALLRGLSVDFARRFPSMEELLDELAPRRRMWWVAGGASVATFAAAAVMIGTQREPAADPCDGIDHRALAGSWNPEIERGLRDAFVRSGNVNGEDVAVRVAASFDRYASDWVAMRRQACEATERRDYSADLYDRQVFCLEGRAAELGALARALAATTRAAAVDSALDSALGLAPLAVCADREALLEQVPLPAEPTRRARASALQAQLAEADARADAGDHAAAAAQYNAAIASIRTLDYPPLLGQALFKLAGHESQSGTSKLAPALLHEAAETAARGRDDSTVARAWIQLALTHRRQRELQAAAAVEPFARTAVARAPHHPGLAADLEWTFGIVARELGRLDDADRRFRAAFALLPPTDTARRADFLQSHGILLRSLGKHEEALGELLEAISIYEQTFGPQSPKLAIGLYNASREYRDLGRCDEAKQSAERSLAIYVRLVGADSPELVLDYGSLGDLAVSCFKDLALARRHYEKAIELAKHLNVAQQALALGRYGAGLRMLGHTAEAEPLIASALALAEQANDPVILVTQQHALGLVRLDLGRAAIALPLLERAASTYESMKARPDLGEMLRAIARAHVALGRPARAIEPLERAIAIARDVAPAQVQAIEHELARVRSRPTK